MIPVTPQYRLQLERVFTVLLPGVGSVRVPKTLPIENVCSADE